MIRKIISFFAHLELPSLAAILASVSASVRSKELVLIWREGGVWVHRCRGFFVLYKEWVSTPAPTTMASYGDFFYDYIPRPGDTVLDIGAGSGTEVIELSRLVGTHGKVYAVEANPLVYARLIRTLELNNLRNVIPLNLAISRECALVGLIPGGPGDHEGVAGSITSSAEHTGSVALAVTLDFIIDSFNLAKVDFAKVNIEGAEAAALLGTSSYFSRVKRWCISCHDFLPEPTCATHKFVSEFLRARGYGTFSREDLDAGNPARFYVYARAPDVI